MHLMRLPLSREPFMQDRTPASSGQMSIMERVVLYENVEF